MLEVYFRAANNNVHAHGVHDFLFTVRPTEVSPILVTSKSAYLVVAVDTECVVQVAAVVSDQHAVIILL